MKQYKHRGYTFNATETTTIALVERNGSHHEQLRFTYEIRNGEGETIKSRDTRPFLTTADACRKHIDEMIEEAEFHAGFRANND